MWFVYGFKKDRVFATRALLEELPAMIRDRREAGWVVHWRPCK